MMKMPLALIYLWFLLPQASFGGVHVINETGSLTKIVIGLGTPFQRDKVKALQEMAQYPFIPETKFKDLVLMARYPSEKMLVDEYQEYVEMLQHYGVEVVRPDPDAAYSFDYTCPRDIGFVVGDEFVISNMGVESRSQEFKTVLHHLEDVPKEKIISIPEGALVEGGDILVQDGMIFVGIHKRTNWQGYEFLRDRYTSKGYEVIPVKHDKLHLDCCMNMLGQGHMLIHLDSLKSNPKGVMDRLARFKWIEVDDVEREHLATNVLSVSSETVFARDHVNCRRVNQEMRRLGYKVVEIHFDGVPATGGSLRCASLTLNRAL